MGIRERLSGNEAVAYAMKQINPDVMGAYPITPSTEIPQYFSTYVDNGEVDTLFIAVESEHSAMSTCIGAEAAGCRAISATSSCGLAFMYEMLYVAASARLPITLAHRLAKRLEAVRQEVVLPWLRPDGKAQVSVAYRDGVPVGITTVVLSAQHDPDITVDDLREALRQEVVLPVLPAELVREDTLLYINPTGRFVTGGPAADSGLTGRKPLADTYGSAARYGGGSLSGKDPTKADRTGAYLARYLAKNIVEAGLADRCEVQLAYAIGLADPVSVTVDTFGTGTVRDQVLAKWLGGKRV